MEVRAASLAVGTETHRVHVTFRKDCSFIHCCRGIVGVRGIANTPAGSAVERERLDK